MLVNQDDDNHSSSFRNNGSRSPGKSVVNSDVKERRDSALEMTDKDQEGGGKAAATTENSAKNLFKNTSLKIEQLKSTLSKDNGNCDLFLNNVTKEHETIEEKKDRCLQVMNFILNYRLDQETAENARKEIEKKEKLLLDEENKRLKHRTIRSMSDTFGNDTESGTQSRPATGS